MSTKVMTCVCFAAVLSGGIFLAGTAITGTANEWMISVDEQVNGTPGNGLTTFICLKPGFDRLPEKVTGPQCAGQSFQRTPDRLSWTLSCGGLSGEGQLTFSGDGKTMQGDVRVVKGGQTITRHIEGDIEDQCSM